MPDIFTSQEADSGAEARICGAGLQQLALGAYPNAKNAQAFDSGRRSVGSKKGHRRRKARSMGRYPFLTAMNALLRETAPYYAKSTQDERRRKMRRVFDILEDLRAQGAVKTSSPAKISEDDIGAFVGWLKANLDATTGAHYLKFLDEVLQSVGNNVILRLKVKRRNLLPRTTAKSIRTLSSDTLDVLLSGDWSLEDPWWDAVAKGAVALYAHTGLRSTELRLAKVSDLDLERGEICVSNPKGMGRWTDGTEISPIMPGCEDLLEEYLNKRQEVLLAYDAATVEALFPFISRNGKVGNWSAAMWAKLKAHIELASGVSFRWKDFRPTLAQVCKDAGAPIEAISKVLRHSSSMTTERYYARIRPESAFSQVRAAWQAWKPLQAEIRKVQNQNLTSKSKVG
ncbi:MAG: site-specific integrase [Thermoplasmata archaeon]